ncbi:MAG: type II toxin-antitoxin system RelE/ParE family toxin [Acidobacteriaceae bacterium]
MSRYRLSALAELDLADIADYTTDVWGAKQAGLYLDSLVECFDRIAQVRGLGRASDSVHPGFRRIEQGKHVVFYKPRRRDVFIGRILHQNMLPTRHQLMEDEVLKP